MLTYEKIVSWAKAVPKMLTSHAFKHFSDGVGEFNHDLGEIISCLIKEVEKFKDMYVTVCSNNLKLEDKVRTLQEQLNAANELIRCHRVGEKSSSDRISTLLNSLREERCKNSELQTKLNNYRFAEDPQKPSDKIMFRRYSILGPSLYISRDVPPECAGEATKKKVEDYPKKVEGIWKDIPFEQDPLFDMMRKFFKNRLRVEKEKALDEAKKRPCKIWIDECPETKERITKDHLD